jgi:hypothetical protein
MKISRRAMVAGLAALPFLPRLAAAQSRQKAVLAFYYGWYGPGIHWPPQTPILDTPAAGTYDSLDPATVRRHAEQARVAGLTGLVASWWGQGDRTDKQLPLLLDACHAQGLKVCAYVEQADSPETLADDILYLHSTYGQHPAWLRLKDRPVIMLFDRPLQTLGLDGWDKARKKIATKTSDLAFIGTANSVQEIMERAQHFDALHIYSQQFAVAHSHLFRGLWTRKYYRDWVHVQTQAGLGLTTATVLPGYDDRIQPDRTGKRPVVERRDGKAYGELWLAAIKADPDWVFVVSFNEWHEGTEIEPSTQYGDAYLKATSDYSRAFRKA